LSTDKPLNTERIPESMTYQSGVFATDYIRAEAFTV